MPSVIFVTISMGGGGTERVISILANYMVKQNMDVTVLMIADNVVEYELDKRIKLIGVSEATGGSLTGRIKRIFAMRKVFKQNPEAGIIAMGTVAAMFSIIADSFLGNPLIAAERNDPNRLNHKPIKSYVKAVRNFLYGRAKSIVLQTEDVRECFPSKLMKKGVVIPNPLSNELPLFHMGTAREKTVITAGRLTEQKNHKLLIDAFAEFSNLHPEYHLKIFGKGELEKELQEYIEKKELKDKVKLCGFSQNLYKELQIEGIYVSSSDWEGISNSMVEALAFGIPTIATDCPMGGARMCIQNGENGILIPMGNKQALVENLCKLAENPEYAEALSREAVQVRKRYSEEKIAGLWLEALGID